MIFRPFLNSFERSDAMGGKPSKGTPADRRLKANKGKPAAANPAFGSKAWDAKYGIKPKAKGK